MEVIHGHFKDKMTYDGKSKTAISVRDGYLEYMGSEIGKEPSDKIFKVFRSPATIANVATEMQGIPLTDEHVDLDQEVQSPRGKVIKASMVDFNDDSTHSKLAIKNVIDVDDEAKGILDTGKRELSLGYSATLVPFKGDNYDFEQRDIKAHHLAIVDQGRCGSQCSFIDKKPKENEMNKRQQEFLDAIKSGAEVETSFIDEKGAPNMQEIVDMTAALPEAIKSMPIDELKKLAPKLQSIIANANGGVAEDNAEDEKIGDEDEMKDEDAEQEDEMKSKDEEAEEMKDEEGEKMKAQDSAKFKDAVKEAVEKQVKEHTEVIVKASDFVDEKYDFKGKTTNQIMRDALKVEHGAQDFQDAELPVAFKLLKKSSGRYANFADGRNETKLDDLKNKEL